jgi:hypothetical protein
MNLPEDDRLVDAAVFESDEGDIEEQEQEQEQEQTRD